jgi:hypothetical protein
MTAPDVHRGPAWRDVAALLAVGCLRPLVARQKALDAPAENMALMGSPVRTYGAPVPERTQ